MVHSSFLSKPETMNWWFRAQDSLDLNFFVFLYIKKEPKKTHKMTQQFFKWLCRPSTCDVGFNFPRPHTTSSDNADKFRGCGESVLQIRLIYIFVQQIYVLKIFSDFDD